MFALCQPMLLIQKFVGCEKVEQAQDMLVYIYKMEFVILTRSAYPNHT